LEFLAQGTLPGIEAIMKNQERMILSKND